MNQFTSVSVPKRRKHKYNLGFMSRLTCNMGQLIPCYIQEVLPNDTFNLNVQNLIRLAPLRAPIMGEIDVYLHFFFVPNRLIWTEWETFITQSRNGFRLSEEDLPSKPVYRLNSTDFATATSSSNNLDGESLSGVLKSGSLADYFGFQTFNSTPDGVNTSMTYDLDAMPFRAYNLIYSQYYRDENLTEDPWFNPDGQDWFAEQSGIIEGTRSRDERKMFMQLRYRSWKKDYFTSALPFAQKGDDVLIPGSGSVQSGFVPLSRSQSGISDFQAPSISGSSGNVVAESQATPGENGPVQLRYPGGGNLISLNAANFGINLNGSASEATIRELRRAMAAQRYLEAKAVGGTRYQEQNLMMFGIRGSDARLQRVEFLGGTKNHVVISQLLQTSETTAQSPLGTPAGNGVSAGGDHIFKKTFSEYGWIVGILSIMPKADYMNGIPKMFLRNDVYDYYWPQFSRIGEQPIQNQELYFNPIYGSTLSANNNNTGTFGYTPRYAEYRFRNNQVSGDFKSSLNFWTLARNFDTTPVLNQNFVECHPRNDIFAVTDESIHKFWCEFYFDVNALRCVDNNPNALI